MSLGFFTSFMGSLWSLLVNTRFSLLGFSFSLSNFFIASVAIFLVFYLIFGLIRMR